MNTSFFINQIKDYSMNKSFYDKHDFNLTKEGSICYITFPTIVI